MSCERVGSAVLPIPAPVLAHVLSVLLIIVVVLLGVTPTIQIKNVATPASPLPKGIVATGTLGIPPFDSSVSFNTAHL